MKNNKLISMFGIILLSTTLLTSVSTIVVQSEESNISVVENSNEFHSGNYVLNNKGIDITSEAFDKISGETQSVVLKFKSNTPNQLQALFGASNSKAGFRNNYFSIFMRDTGEIGIEVRDQQRGINYLFSRPASIWGIHKGEPVENTVVFIADSTAKTYTVYVNGTKIISETVNNFLPISGIGGLDNVSVGSVNREGRDAYTMNGQVSQLSIYNRILSDEEIQGKVGQLP